MPKQKDKLYEGEKLANFRELVHRYETRYADKTAFIYKKTPKSTKHICISYQEFVQDIKGFATALLHLGMQGKKVALIAPNRYEWCTSYLAVATAGITIIPLDKIGRASCRERV